MKFFNGKGAKLRLVTTQMHKRVPTGKGGLKCVMCSKGTATVCNICTVPLHTRAGSGGSACFDVFHNATYLVPLVRVARPYTKRPAEAPSEECRNPSSAGTDAVGKKTAASSVVAVHRETADSSAVSRKTADSSTVAADNSAVAVGRKTAASSTASRKTANSSTVSVGRKTAASSDENRTTADNSAVGVSRKTADSSDESRKTADNSAVAVGRKTAAVREKTADSSTVSVSRNTAASSTVLVGREIAYSDATTKRANTRAVAGDANVAGSDDEKSADEDHTQKCIGHLPHARQPGTGAAVTDPAATCAAQGQGHSDAWDPPSPQLGAAVSWESGDKRVRDRAPKTIRVPRASPLVPPSTRLGRFRNAPPDRARVHAPPARDGQGNMGARMRKRKAADGAQMSRKATKGAAADTRRRDEPRMPGAPHATPIRTQASAREPLIAEALAVQGLTQLAGARR